MKMNVKGLVFVGFAAAVFAGAAQADGDKIVTSKTYVDNKITQTIGTSTTTAPSENAVKEALALKYDATNPDGYITSAGVPVKGIKAYGADSNITPDANGIVTLPAAQAVNNGTLSIQVGSETPQTFTANTAGDTTVTLGAAAGKGVATTVTTDGTDLPTAGAVDTAITTAITNAAADYQTKSTTAQQVSNGAGGWEALTTTNAVTQNSTTPITSGGVYTALQSYSTDGEKNTIESVKVNGTALGVTDEAVNITVAEGATNGTIAVNGADVSVHGLGDAAYVGTDSTVSSSGTGVPTTAAVATAIENAAAAVLPGNNEGTAACSATKPCALVWTGSGQPTWEQIQQ